MLGIDPSLTKLGLVHYNGSSHTAKLIKPKYTGVRRLRFIMEALQDTFFEIGLENIDAVAMEDYAFAAKSQHHKIGEGGAAIKLALFDTFGKKEEAGFPYIVGIGTLKKFVTGRGDARKDDIKLHVYKKWDVEFSDDNEADAYGLARWMWALKKGAAFKYEEEALKKYKREN